MNLLKKDDSLCDDDGSTCFKLLPYATYFPDDELQSSF